MQDMMNKIFGPLDSKYCDYFYILSVIGFLLLVVLVTSSLFVGISKRKGIDFYLGMIGVSFGYIILYFQNRLLYSMCTDSL